MRSMVTKVGGAKQIIMLLESPLPVEFEKFYALSKKKKLQVLFTRLFSMESLSEEA